MVKGWPNEPARHSLAARGCKTGRKGSRRRYAKGIKPQKLSDISPEDLHKLRDLDDDDLLEVLVKIGKRGGLFDGIRADGDPHLKKGVGSNGIAYLVDPESGTVRFMDITEIAGATGDPYWTEKQAGYDTKWETKYDKAYVITQSNEHDLLDLLKLTIHGDRFVGSYGGTDKLMDIMISYQAYWGGDEALYHSRAEAWEDFQ